MQRSQHTISVLVENQPGVLAHISGLFAARGFNIDSLAVGETEDPTASRMTIVVNADAKTLEQVVKQLNRLVDVIKVQDLTDEPYVDRELIMVKVSATPANRSELLQVAEIFRARVVDIGIKSLTIEATGDQEKVEALIDLLRPYGLKELVRTGRVAIARENSRVKMGLPSERGSPSVDDKHVPPS